MNRQELIDVIRDKALQFGSFTLASGKQASFYLDCRRLTLDASAVRLIADGLVDLCDPWPAAVGGMELGAVPITAVMLCCAHDRQRPLRGFVVRKQAKAHGTGRLIEGPVEPGDRVFVVEDVVTTGGSSLRAVDACRDFGLHVQGVLAIVDRLEGATDTFRQTGLVFRPLVTIRDLGVEPE
jgi:orotate phosphoribosyltransferase